MTLPAALVVFTCIVTAYLLGRADGRRIGRPRRQHDAPASGPPLTAMPPTASQSRAEPGQTLIVPPCGCVNTFTRTDIIRCPEHAARAAAAWADEMHRKTGL